MLLVLFVLYILGFGASIAAFAHAHLILLILGIIFLA